jgi:hypothetical protein
VKLKRLTILIIACLASRSRRPGSS